MKFTITINISLNGYHVNEKLYTKTLAQDVFDRRWILNGLKHWSKYQCKIFNFVDICSGVGICGRPQPKQVNDVTVVIFSIKCFNQLKLYHLSRSILRKRSSSYFFLFINEHLIKYYWSSTVNPIAAAAVLLTSWLYRC